MTTGAEGTTQKLVNSLMEFNKTFRLFSKTLMQANGAAWQESLAGCKQGEIGLLFMLGHVSKPDARGLKVSEISKMMHVTSPSVTQMLKGLEAHGLIERHVDPHDRRAVAIALTERGEDVARKAHEMMLINFHGLADYLGEEECNQLAALLLKSRRYFSEKMSTMYPSLWNGDEDA